MYIDQYTRVATAKAFNTTVGTGVTTLTDTVDMQQAKDVGQGEDIYAVFTITTSLALSVSGTTYFQVGYGDTAVPGTFYPITQTHTYGDADLVAGRQVVCRLNPLTAPSTNVTVPLVGYRYLCARTVTSTQATAGAFTCDIVYNIQGNRQSYTSGLPAFVAGA
jgi:hypothetical protein